MTVEEKPRRAGRGGQVTTNKTQHYSTTTSRPVERLAECLEKVRWTSGGGFVACCPAHDDRTPSLHVSEGEDGRALVYCFASCGFTEIVEAAGLQPSDMFPDDGRPKTPCPGRLTAKDRRTIRDALTHERTVIEILAADAKAGRLSPADGERWALAMDRIEKAKGALNG